MASAWSRWRCALTWTGARPRAGNPHAGMESADAGRARGGADRRRSPIADFFAIPRRALQARGDEPYGIATLGARCHAHRATAEGAHLDGPADHWKRCFDINPSPHRLTISHARTI